MERHLNELISLVPNLLKMSMLDLGSGRGRFILEVLKRGGNIVGLEPYDRYIKETKDSLEKMNLFAEIFADKGENLPFEDNKFDFINISEVIEHTENPTQVFKEVSRVLKEDGKMYVSVPNRYGFKDPHFHIYLVNWLPRSWSDVFISIFGQHKDYVINNGLQRLSEMHYFSYGKAKKFFEELGFEVCDIRELKITKRFKGLKKMMVYTAYQILRPWYFDSFHFLISKK